jgi:hypothetical protein
MIQITNLTDEELSSCIYQKIVTVQELRALLAIDGVITANRINQDLFANYFTRFIENRTVNNNVNWAIPYFIADDITDYINENR